MRLNKFYIKNIYNKMFSLFYFYGYFSEKIRIIFPNKIRKFLNLIYFHDNNYWFNFINNNEIIIQILKDILRILI